MDGEFNNLSINNTPITFTGKTDNIATSDELLAPAIYDTKKATAYARSKTIAKVISATGIAIIATAASIKAGALISNAFVLNPPSISNTVFDVNDGIFAYSFSVTNQNEYKVEYYILVDGLVVVNEDCSLTNDYDGSFSDINDDQKGCFYIQFSNNVDYKKTLIKVNFTTGGIEE